MRLKASTVASSCGNAKHKAASDIRSAWPRDVDDGGSNGVALGERVRHCSSIEGFAADRREPDTLIAECLI
jgi:hypothetical protein